MRACGARRCLKADLDPILAREPSDAGRSDLRAVMHAARIKTAASSRDRDAGDSQLGPAFFEGQFAMAVAGPAVLDKLDTTTYGEAVKDIVGASGKVFTFKARVRTIKASRTDAGPSFFTGWLDEEERPIDAIKHEDVRSVMFCVENADGIESRSIVDFRGIVSKYEFRKARPLEIEPDRHIIYAVGVFEKP